MYVEKIHVDNARCYIEHALSTTIAARKIADASAKTYDSVISR